MKERRPISARERLTLDRATKRQKRRYPHLSWKACRGMALIWCTKMWPDFAGTAQKLPGVVQ